jgi:cyanophycinase-like exopeptidase
MKNKFLVAGILLIYSLSSASFAQNYTSYLTGNVNDVVTQPLGGICLMGGATEDDNAMAWFLARANGGDVLVLRTSGSDGYNNYLYSTLGVSVNSVETIVCSNTNASYDSYVLERIEKAEAIWFAGGNQWNYISYWRNTPVDSLINQAIQTRNVVVGGTSAGMAIQGQSYFSAQNGTVTSSTALSNPYNNAVTVDASPFLEHPILTGTITDTHFDNPDRKGRLSVFLARMLIDQGVNGKAIACDEYTAVCVDENGLARVFGGYPAYDDFAYFVQVNCTLEDPLPETCSSGQALTWNKGGEALKVLKLPGTIDGTYTFDLNNWQTSNGGDWLNWSVNNGIFTEQAGNPVNCENALTETMGFDVLSVYPNPLADQAIIRHPYVDKNDCWIEVSNVLGQFVNPFSKQLSETSTLIDLNELEDGVYLIHLKSKGRTTYTKRILKQTH